MNSNASPNLWKSPLGLVMLLGGVLGAVASGVTILEYTNKKDEKTEKQTQQESDGKTLPVSQSGPIDRQDAASTAKAVLLAYQRRNFGDLAEFSEGKNQELLQDLEKRQHAHPVYAEFTSGPLWRAISEWDGELGEIRYRHYVGTENNTYEAHIRFADLELPEIAILVLQWKNGQWVFEDLNSPNLGSFLQGRKVFSLEAAPY